MKRVAELIGMWPTMADLGRDLGVSYPTVAAWKQRGSIPVAYWRDVVRAARRRGYDITAESLIDLHDPPRPAPVPGGFAEDAPKPPDGEKVDRGPGSQGHFSRWKPIRRAHFATAKEVVDHVDALRSEWDRR